jgi:hypothetical protein
VRRRPDAREHLRKARLQRFTKSFLTAPVFAIRAYRELEALNGDQFRMRSVPSSKQLIEEVIPLAAWLKHFEIPDRHVRCRYTGLDGPCDAMVRIAGPEVEHGFLRGEYFVEITTAVSPKDYLRREALTRDGHVFGGDDIRRVGSGKGGTIVSRATAIDGTAAVDNVIAWVKDGLARKAAKSYPTPCLLLVNVEPDRRLGIDEWATVARAVRGSVNRSRFERAFLVDWQTNFVAWL